MVETHEAHTEIDHGRFGMRGGTISNDNAATNTDKT